MLKIYSYKTNYCINFIFNPYYKYYIIFAIK